MTTKYEIVYGDNTVPRIRPCEDSCRICDAGGAFLSGSEYCVTCEEGLTFEQAKAHVIGWLKNIENEINNTSEKDFWLEPTGTYGR